MLLNASNWRMGLRSNGFRFAFPQFQTGLLSDVYKRQTYTSAHSKDSASPGKMAIVLGNKWKEVAAIDSPIRDQGEIHGSFTKEEVETLSLMLRTGNIPASISKMCIRDRGQSHHQRRHSRHHHQPQGRRDDSPRRPRRPQD